MSTADGYVAHILAEAPPLKSEQRAKLAELLRPVRRQRAGRRQP
jgi:hypothetical protein